MATPARDMPRLPVIQFGMIGWLRKRRAAEQGLQETLKAIEFAIVQDIEASTFLRSWREGDLHEWPDYQGFKPE